MTPVADQRAQTRCVQCGQTDDHPKIHIGSLGSGDVATKHHDCLSVAEEQAARGSAQVADSGPKVSAIIDAAKSGTRGPDLVDLILSGALPAAEGLAEKAQLEAELDAMVGDEQEGPEHG